jgi:hypothetical protein
VSTRPTTRARAAERRVVRAAVWLPGLAVAVGAAVATAHGLYEVALAARVPAAIAWLYPLITDGLALVAYAATTRLSGSAGRYAWTVVVLAAGLSGLAQAALLGAGTALGAPAVLRFGVGAWPAVAAAIVAHLLYLLATHTTHTPAATAPVQPAPYNPAPAQPAAATVHPGAVQPGAVQPGADRSVQPAGPAGVQPVRPRPALAPPTAGGTGSSPAQDRARAAAVRHAHRHHRLPTVSELVDAAEVSRGTAATVLKQLRTQPTPLHLITSTETQTHSESTTAETSTQP